MAWSSVDVRRGAAENLPRFDQHFDIVVTVNSLGMWPDPPERLEELRALLRPGGRIAVASQPRCPGATRQTSDAAADHITALLESAGFGGIRVERLQLDPPVVCVLGTA